VSRDAVQDDYYQPNIGKHKNNQVKMSLVTLKRDKAKRADAAISALSKKMNTNKDLPKEFCIITYRFISIF
jgi:hypothetical protein